MNPRTDVPIIRDPGLCFVLYCTYSTSAHRVEIIILGTCNRISEETLTDRQVWSWNEAQSGGNPIHKVWSILAGKPTTVD